MLVCAVSSQNVHICVCINIVCAWHCLDLLAQTKGTFFFGLRPTHSIGVYTHTQDLTFFYVIYSPAFKAFIK